MKDKIKTLNFQINAKSAVPVYEQVKQGIKLVIISGYLEEGDQVMPIRELAAKLMIHPNTIAKVYYQLEVEGFIYARHGSGYYVKHDRKRIQQGKSELLQQVIDETIAKVFQLGYSLQDIIEKLNSRLEKSEKPLPGQGEKK